MNKNLDLLPPLNLGNTFSSNTSSNTSKLVDTVVNSYNNAAKKINTSLNSMDGGLLLPIKNSVQTSLVENGDSKGVLLYTPILLTLGAITVIVILYVTFKYQVDSAVRYILQRIREMMGFAPPTMPTPPQPPEDLRKENPEIINSDESSPVPPVSTPDSILNKIVPENKQVFNISSNIYTYADAAPLCKALGAELATYDQVKQAWERGADWCNYGWIKGQAAVYPTQRETYDKLQKGPESQRSACGQIGVNGGFFDNPGLRFGVNCYGSKPAENEHSVKIVTEGAGQALTPEAMLFDKKVRKFAAESDTIGILPFKPGDWSS